jgi:hypothetical protein
LVLPRPASAARASSLQRCYQRVTRRHNGCHQVARPTKNCTLVVETSVPVTGTVTVEVDSSDPSPAFD